MTYLEDDTEDDYLTSVERFKTDLKSLLEQSQKSLPKSRESSLALTKLEEAFLWALRIEEKS